MSTDDLADVWARFKTAAQRYCASVESSLASPDPQQLHTDLTTCLAELYAAALPLPPVTPDTDQIEPSTVGRDRRRDLFDALSAIVDDEGPYWLVFDPYEYEEPLEATVADDLVDVYCDVYAAAMCDDRPPPNDLIWETRFSFYNHWGYHALNALRAIYWKCRWEWW